MGQQRPLGRAALRIPQRDRTGSVARCEPLSVGGDRQGRKWLLVGADGPQRLPGAAPDPQRPVVAGGGKPLPVGCRDRQLHPLRVSIEGAPRDRTGPLPHRAIGASCKHHRAVGGRGDIEHAPRMPPDRSAIGAIGGIHPTHGPGVVADDQRGAIRRRCQGVCRNAWRQIADRLHRGDVDELNPAILAGDRGDRLPGEWQQIADPGGNGQGSLHGRGPLPEAEGAIDPGGEDLLRVPRHKRRRRHPATMDADHSQRPVEKRAAEDDPPRLVSGEKLRSIGPPGGRHPRGRIGDRGRGPRARRRARTCRVEPFGVPQPRGRIGAGGDQRSAVGREGQPRGAADMGRSRQERTHQGEVPDPHRVVLRRRDERPTVTTDRHPGYRAGVAGKPAQFLPRGGLPEKSRAIGGDRHHPFAVGRELGRKRGPLMAAEDHLVGLGSGRRAGQDQREQPDHRADGHAGADGGGRGQGSGITAEDRRRRSAVHPRSSPAQICHPRRRLGILPDPEGPITPLSSG